jgi:Glycosyltransferases involved in cell wall biogenesis
VTAYDTTCQPANNGVPVPLGAVPTVARKAVTVIVPTRNEAGNVGPLLDRVAATAMGRDIEVLFVDDSDDDTPREVLALADKDRADRGMSVRLIHREPGSRTGGLGGAVVEGLRQARGSWAVVMDGDLQHPPELALRLADVGRSRKLDLVVASRYVGGGDATGLGTMTRHAVSGVATGIAKLMFPRRLAQPTDPMSGFFAVRRAALALDRLEPSGFKILMEILVRNPGLRLAEVPFSMGPRLAGESKASLAEGTRFIGHLARLRCAVLGARIARSAGGGPGHRLGGPSSSALSASPAWWSTRRCCGCSDCSCRSCTTSSQPCWRRRRPRAGSSS